MKRLRWLAVLLVAIATTLLPVPVMGASEAGVTVVATPDVGDGITSFTATIITDTQVDLEWTVDVDITSVIIRAQYGSMPMSRTEGYLVYEGSGSSISDTSMNFDTEAGELFYRIWAYHDTIGWLDSEVQTQSLESLIMTLLAVFALCGIITAVSFRNSFPLLKLAAATAWIGAMLYFKDNPPSQIAEGSASHTVFLLVLIMIALAVPLAGLGREIQKQQNSTKVVGGKGVFSDWNFRWGKGGGEYTMPNQQRKHMETAYEYREKVRLAHRRRR